MNRIDRLTAILVQLQSKRSVPINELEIRFEVSRRTIFRDIRSLIEAGVPIGGDASAGYFIVDGYHLPPVMFSKDEAAALLVAGKVLERSGDTGLSQNFQNALLKIKAVLRYSDKEYLENLDEQIAVMTPKLPAHNAQSNYTSEIQQAIACRNQLYIAYYSNYKEEINERKIDPLGLVYYANRWHLIAYCHLRKALRDFRTDRVRNLKILTSTYQLEDHPNYLEFLNTAFDASHAQEVIVDFTKNAARIIQDQRYFQGYVSEEKTPNGIRMRFLTSHLEYFARWLMMFGSEARVVSPAELTNILLRCSDELSAHLKKNHSGEKSVT